MSANRSWPCWPRAAISREDAAELVEIEYETLGDVVDPEAAAEPGAPLLHEEAGTNVLVTREFGRGDAEAAFKDAAHVVGGRFRFRRKTPVAIENRSYLGRIRSRQAFAHHAFDDAGAGPDP